MSKTEIVDSQHETVIATTEHKTEVTSDTLIVIEEGGGSGGDADTLQGNDSAYHLDRLNHTGEQPQSTVTGLVAALAALVSTDAVLQTAIDDEVTARINAILGILFLLESKADLVGGLIPASQIPAVAITEYLGVVDDESEMLALSGQRGDWCQRDDLSKAYILVADDATQLSSWKEWPMPVSPVTSVNGQVGVVVLGKADIGLSNVPNIDATKRENHTGTQDAGSTLTGFFDVVFSAYTAGTNAAINAADSLGVMLRKLQAQISALATVARTGSYNDLSDKPAIRVRDGFDYYAYLGDRWLNPNITNQTDTLNAPWGQLHNAAIIPAANNTSLMYALLEFDLCAFPTAAADGNLVVLINGVIVNSTISNSLGNTNYFARIQLEIFRRTGGSIAYLVRSEMVGTPLFRGLHSPVTSVPIGIDLPIELRFRPTSFNTVEHISTTNCTLAVKRVQNGV